jgi:hypothetical protein
MARLKLHMYGSFAESFPKSLRRMMEAAPMFEAEKSLAFPFEHLFSHGIGNTAKTVDQASSAVQRQDRDATRPQVNLCLNGIAFHGVTSASHRSTSPMKRVR